ncbi:hypothetical protein ID866_12875 [Astraeus odoratus]|nr:hypothetical protein ID866_12875 [Astraeus odoratus]
MCVHAPVQGGTTNIVHCRNVGSPLDEKAHAGCEPMSSEIDRMTSIQQKPYQLEADIFSNRDACIYAPVQSRITIIINCCDIGSLLDEKVHNRCESTLYS